MTSNETLTEAARLSFPTSLSPSPPHHAPASPAAIELRLLLARLKRENKQGGKVPTEDLPAVENLVPLLLQQDTHIQHLENENLLYRQELSFLSDRPTMTVDENCKLGEHSKFYAVKNDTEELSVLVNQEEQDKVGNATITKTGHQDPTKLQYDIETIKSLHVAKAERLEAQLRFTKLELKKTESECQQLRKQLQSQETMILGSCTDSSAKLCVKCETNLALLPATKILSYEETISKLSQERDEVMSSIIQLRTTLEDNRQREEQAHNHVKNSVELVEQTQLEKMQALVEKEQLRDELQKMRERMAEAVSVAETRLQQEREIIRKEYQREAEEQNSKIVDLQSLQTSSLHQLDKVTRAKLTLMKDFEQAKRDVKAYQEDMVHAAERAQADITQAYRERDLAVQDLSRYKQSQDTIMQQIGLERNRLDAEVRNLRSQVASLEREIVNHREENIGHTRKIQGLQRELSLCSADKNKLETICMDNMQILDKKFKQQETELNGAIHDLEVKHTTTKTELENMLSEQTALTAKLKLECQTLLQQLEQSTYKHRNGKKLAQTQIHELTERLQTEKKIRQMAETQNKEHGKILSQMTGRLKGMDEHASQSAQQICELLNSQNKLLQERMVLNRELDFLRTQLNIPLCKHLESTTVQQPEATVSFSFNTEN